MCNALGSIANPLDNEGIVNSLYACPSGFLVKIAFVLSMISLLRTDEEPSHQIT